MGRWTGRRDRSSLDEIFSNTNITCILIRDLLIIIEVANTYSDLMFELCLCVIEAETSHNAEMAKCVVPEKNAKSLHVLVSAIREVSNAINDTDEFMLFQVSSVLFKTLSRMLSTTLSIQTCTISSLTKCIACLELEVNLLKKLRMASLTSPSSTRKNISELFAALTFSTPPSPQKTHSPEVLGHMLFYNIIVLEASKAPLKLTSSSTGDWEHIALLSLTFFTVFFDAFGPDLLLLRAEVELTPGQASGVTGTRGRVLDFLKGPYLAQLIQSCLQLSQHRSKALVAAALSTLHGVLRCTFDSTFGPPPPDRACPPPNAAMPSAPAAAEWRTFYPGIFGGLFPICMSGYKRGSSLLFLALDLLLKVTTVVTADVYTNILVAPSMPAASAPDTDDSGPEQLMSRLLARGGHYKSSSPLSDTKGRSGAAVKRHVEQDEGLPSVVLSDQWRADLLQRIVEHLPRAYREVVRVVASSGVRGVEPPHHSGESQRGEDQASDESYHARLMDSLVALLLHSKHFLGQAAIADFSVLLFEAVSLDVPSALLSEAGLSSPAALVGLKAWRAIRQLRAMCDCALWRDVQSRFIHKFVDAVISLNRLAPAAQTDNAGDDSVGGSEHELLACLQLIVGCSYMLHSGGGGGGDTPVDDDRSLVTAIRILLNANLGDGSCSSQLGGALRCLVHPFLPLVTVSSSVAAGGRRGVTSSSSSWQQGRGSSVHMLSMRRYHFPVGGIDKGSGSGTKFVSGGYYKAPYVYLALGLASADDGLIDGSSGAASTAASKKLRRLCGVFGSSKLSAAVVSQLWEESLVFIEQNFFQEKISSRPPRRSQKRSRKTSDDLTELQVAAVDSTERRKNRRREKQTTEEYRALQWAIGTSEFLHYTMLGVMDASVLGGGLALANTDLRNCSPPQCACALCGELGSYHTSPEITRIQTTSPSLLRCSRCQAVFYCCKSHQKKHWGAHRSECKPASERRSGEESVSSPGFVGSRLLHMSHHVVKRISSFLRAYLVATAAAAAAATASVSATLRMLLVSTLLEVLGTVFFDVAVGMESIKQQQLLLTSAGSSDSCGGIGARAGGVNFSEVAMLQAQLQELEKNGKMFLLDVISPLLSLAVDGATAAANMGTANISRQAAMTTLSRVSLYMGYGSGPDMLRCNLDYIVDSVCLYLHHLQRTTKHTLAGYDYQRQVLMRTSQFRNENVPHVETLRIASGLGSELVADALLNYDSRVVTVVGLVLEAILAEKGDSSSGAGSEEAPVVHSAAIDLLMRDMVEETLRTIDLLSAVATASGQQAGGRDSVSVQVGPLLDLMHSLVRTTVKPLAGIPNGFLTPSDRAERRVASVDCSHENTSSSRGGGSGLFSTSYFMCGAPSVPPSTHEVPRMPVDMPKQHSVPSEGSAKKKLLSDLDAMAASLAIFSKQWKSSQDKLFEKSERDVDDAKSSTEFKFPWAGEEEGTGEGDVAYQDEDQDEDAAPAPELELVVKVLQKCHYFLACADLSAQVSVVNIMMSGFSRLAKNKKLCLPALHKAWPSIITRIKELRALYVVYHHHHYNHRGSSSDCDGTELAVIQKLYLLPHLLQLVSLLAFLCGDFVSTKFKEDLWPELMIVLHVCSQEVLLSLPHASSSPQTPSASTNSREAKSCQSPTKRETLDNLLCASKSLLFVPTAVPLGNTISSSTNAAAPILIATNSSAGPAFHHNSSRFSLLEKLKSSVLVCLLQLAGMPTRDISAGTMSGSCLGGEGGEGDAASTSANPLAPIAPLCLWLLLPLAAAPAPAQHQELLSSRGGPTPENGSSLMFDTMLNLSRLNAPFAISLCDVLVALGAPAKTLVQDTERSSESSRCPSLAWEGMRALPVIAASYTSLNKQAHVLAHAQATNTKSSAVFSSAMVLPRLLGAGGALGRLCEDLAGTLLAVNTC